MPQPQEKTPDGITELPNPELNPLLNPMLGRNLGRWAEVYFTSPPEKREEAVGELLRELKAEPVSEPSDREEDTPHNFETSEIVAGTQCAVCGHHHDHAQRFCGMCGIPLGTEERTSAEYRARQPVHPDSLREAELAPGVEEAPLFSMIAPPVQQATFDDGTEIAWLREKNLASEASRSSAARRYAPALLAIVAIGVLIYAQSRPQGSDTRPATSTSAPARVERAGPTSQPSNAPSAPAPAPEAVPSNPAANGEPATANPAAAIPGPAAANGTARATPPKAMIAAEKHAPVVAAPSRPVPQSSRVSAPPPETEVSSATNGSEELVLAMDYLNGKRGPRDSVEAAKFLWKAVGKENPSAILLLSDMYLVGDGVPKSCDQARLLLNAAARKNVPQAAQKLRNLQMSGCR